MSPKDAFDNVIKRAENQLVLHAALVGIAVGALPAAEKTTLQNDVLRSALVIAVSALDRYVHDRVTKGIISAYKTTSLNREQEDFTVPVSVAIAVARKAADATGAKQVRAANLIRVELQELLHKRPFQSWREIETAFKLIGISGIAGTIQNSIGLGDIAPVKTALGNFVKQRNLIVHEGSLLRHKRGGKPVEIEIDAPFVTDAINTIKQIIDGLEDAV